MNEFVFISGFIEFVEKDALFADELISKGYLEIEDKRFHVTSFDEYMRRFKEGSMMSALNIRPMEVTVLHPQPPEQDSPNHILNVLNDDCLIAIFKKLHFSTLSTVVNVCVRFNCVAKITFSSKYRTKPINILELDWYRRPTLLQIENFLCEFGLLISAVSTTKEKQSNYHYTPLVPIGACDSLNEFKITNDHFKLIDKYCKNLKELKINFEFIDEIHIFHECSALFKRLKKLQITFTANKAILDLISVCSELKILHINFERYYANEVFIKPKIVIPKLIEVRFRGGYCYSYYSAVNQFLELNPTLEILEIEGREYSISIAPFNLPPLFMQALAPMNSKYSPFIHTTRLLGASTLSNIITYQIRDVDSQTTTYFDSLILLLESVPNIKKLDICFNALRNDAKICKAKDIFVKTILEYAKHLSQLTLCYRKYPRPENYHKTPEYFSPINVRDYNDILAWVQERNNGIKLTIKYKFHTNLHTPGDRIRSQSIQVFDMVSDLLTIEIRTCAQ